MPQFHASFQKCTPEVYIPRSTDGPISLVTITTILRFVIVIIVINVMVNYLVPYLVLQQGILNSKCCENMLRVLVQLPLGFTQCYVVPNCPLVSTFIKAIACIGSYVRICEGENNIKFLAG